MKIIHNGQVYNSLQELNQAERNEAIKSSINSSVLSLLVYCMAMHKGGIKRY